MKSFHIPQSTSHTFCHRKTLVVKEGMVQGQEEEKQRFLGTADLCTLDLSTEREDTVYDDICKTRQERKQDRLETEGMLQDRAQRELLTPMT